MQVLLLYLLAGQQTSTFRCQKLDLFYSKFQAELNEYIPSVQKQHK